MIKIVKNGYLGTETPYIYQKSCYTKPPMGYKPFYINHIGRHGARYLANIRELNQMIEILESAKYQGKLTVEGEILKTQLECLWPVEAEEEGLLSSSGYGMEQGIAKRMYQNYPMVFGKEVFAVSTYVERTKQSMAAFLNALGQCTSSKLFRAKSNGEVDPILRFFDINEAYLEYQEKGQWKEQLSQFSKRQDISTPILRKFFKTEYINQMKEPEQFVAGLYEVYRNQFDIGSNVGLGYDFSEEQLKILWENENARQYLEKGPSNVGQVLPTNIAFPLLMDFLYTSEEAIKYRERSANLRFAHAETIIPFTGLLRLLGFFNQTNAPGQIAVLWQDYWVSPMAANLQWIFYAHPTRKEILIKMLYNESEIQLPIRSVYGPYYEYKTIRSFYLKQIRAMNLNWNEPLNKMLKNYVPKWPYC